MARFFDSLDALPDSLRGGAVAIGNFDGVHRGHARIVERLIAQARQRGGPALVFTFDPHPMQLLRPDDAPPPLSDTPRKADLLSRLGVDGVLFFPTDVAMLRLSPEEFFEQIIVRQLRAVSLVEGPNFFFGRNRRGDIGVLRQLCGLHRVDLEIVPPIHHEGSIISSSRVRTLIAQGNVQAAAGMLTQPYQLRGVVEFGQRRGGPLGFPTANLGHIQTLIPAAGVYAAAAWLDGRHRKAAVHIGPNPTFAETRLKVEAHLLDFEGQLYGAELAVDFYARLRDVQTFDSAAALQAQLRIDIAAAAEAVPT